MLQALGLISRVQKQTLESMTLAACLACSAVSSVRAGQGTYHRDLSNIFVPPQSLYILRKQMAMGAKKGASV